MGNRLSTSAQALETSIVCKIPYPELEALSFGAPGLQRQLRNFMVRQILAIKTMLILLGKYSAEERLAYFILHVSDHSVIRGYRPENFSLGMSRYDIANFLGLSTETVSRQFAHFQDLKIISTRGKQVEIHDMDGLRKLAGSLGKHDYPLRRFSVAVPFAGNR